MENLDPVRLVEAWKLFTEQTPYAAAITLFFVAVIALAILVNWVIVPLMKGRAALKSGKVDNEHKET